MTGHRGGCTCGAIRYHFQRYTDAGYCHCAGCRRSSGAPVVAWARVADSELTLEGEPVEFDGRGFCATCGSTLYQRHGRVVAVCLGTLDDPDPIVPRVHVCGEEQVAWLKLADLMPVVDGLTPPPTDERHVPRKPVDDAVTAASTVSLQPIDAGNLHQVLTSDVRGSQRRFVAANAISLAQAYVAGDAWHRAICVGDTVIGFVMAATLADDEHGLPMAGDPNLWRFSIDEGYQGLGLGGRALDLVIEELRVWPGARNIWLSYVDAIGGPAEFYRRRGFVDTGAREDDGEWIMRLPLNTDA